MGKNLDDELAQAAGLDEDEGQRPPTEEGSMAVPQPAEAQAERAEAPRGGKGLLLMLLVMVAGIVSLFLFAFKPAAIYAMPLEQLVAGDDHVGRRVRVEGELVPGSLVKREKPCEYRFSIRGTEQRDKRIPVRFAQCIVPDAFRDVPEGGVLVTAEGTLNEEGHFEATNIMAKCASKYDPETHTMEGGTGQAKAPPDPLE